MNTRIRDDLNGVKGVDERLVDRIERDWLVFDVTKPARKLSKLEAAILAAPPLNLSIVANILAEKYKIPRKSIGRIALSFGHKANDQLDIKRKLELGITKAKWVYSKARSDCGHEILDGKIYNIKTGMRFQGRYIRPGSEPQCICFSKPVIPGFDDEPVRHGLLDRLTRFFKSRL